MNSIIKIKNILLTPLIKMAIKHPKIMESKPFIFAMSTFPEKISSKYDQTIGVKDSDYQEPFLEGLSHIKSNAKSILDICTGTGFAALLAAKHFKNAKIEALDLSDEMISIARNKAKKAKLCNIYFKIGNAMNLPYPSEKFDLVITTNAPIYIQEAVRVLKTNGKMIISFSSGGEVFIKLKKDVIELLRENKMELLEMSIVNKGIFIIATKEK